MYDLRLQTQKMFILRLETQNCINKTQHNKNLFKTI